MSLALSSTETEIHYESTPTGVCPGKDNADRELAAYLANPPDQPSAYSTQLATWALNVTCECCKAYLKENKERRKRMGHVKEVTQR
jgi:hypothetical protein